MGITRMLLGVSSLLAVIPQSLAFGTLNTPPQHAEHEHITRDALGCPLGEASTGDCFEPLSIASLAGDTGHTGAVGAPDIDETFDPHAHCDDADYINFAKFGIPGTYPRTRDQATGALLGCIAHLSDRFNNGLNAAEDLLDDDRVHKSETDLNEIPCTFIGGLNGRAKCDVLEGFGRALHGVQDFYSHSNWADSADSSLAISLNNPPGLQLAPSPGFLDLRRAPDASTLSIPDDLSTGCFVTSLSDPINGAKKCEDQGRLTHETMNKDEGIIVLNPSIPLPNIGPLTSSPVTSRGQIGTNFELAVEGAVIETRRQWSDFRSELVSRYGADRAALIVCALTKDKPWHDCAAL